MKAKKESSKKVSFGSRVSKNFDLATDKLLRLDNKYLVLKNFWALSCIFFAFLILFPLRTEGNTAKILLIIFGLIFIVLAKGLITEFVVKTVRLQADTKVNRYSAIVSLNSIFGLVLPLFLINYVLSKIVFLLSRFSYTGSTLCQLRTYLVQFYFDNYIYWSINKLAFTILLMAVALFLFGGVFERRGR